MSLETLVLIWNVVEVLLHTAILALALGYLIPRLKAWENKYKKLELDRRKVAENVSKGRRSDWGVGQELNWRHTWNENNKPNRKWWELAKITIFAFLGMYILHKVFMFLWTATYMGIFGGLLENLRNV